MIFEITKNNDEIKVNATTDSRTFAKDPVEHINTINVLDFLVEKGYNLENIETVDK